MVDSRAKGARGEYLVRDMLRVHTGLKFERVPASGALEYLKGDLYVPHAKNKYCIEVKNYKDSPLLFFKYDRSPVFVVSEYQPLQIDYMYISVIKAYVSLAEPWLILEKDMGFIDDF